MKDQFNQEVPKDLLVIDFRFDPSEPEEVRVILKADWYEVEGQEGIVLTSAEQINYLCETDPLDCGFPDDWQNLPINRIADSLKRWSPEDGFYHA